MKIAFAIFITLVIVDGFCYWAAIAVDGPKGNLWPGSGFYELYKVGKKHW